MLVTHVIKVFFFSLSFSLQSKNIYCKREKVIRKRNIFLFQVYISLLHTHTHTAKYLSENSRMQLMNAIEKSKLNRKLHNL